MSRSSVVVFHRSDAGGVVARKGRDGANVADNHDVVVFSLNHSASSATDRKSYELAEKVSGAWAAFARCGNPSHLGCLIGNPTPSNSELRCNSTTNCSLEADSEGAVRALLRHSEIVTLDRRRCHLGRISSTSSLGFL